MHVRGNILGVGSGELTETHQCERKSPCVDRGKMVEAAGVEPASENTSP